MAVRLDHLVWAVPDLDAAVEVFASGTGVEPAPGGRHEGLGTANYLVALAGPLGGYLEIIGPTSDGPVLAASRPFGIDTLTEPRLVTWAVATSDIDSLHEHAANGGVDLGEIRAMSRAMPSGELLSWRLTVPPAPLEHGLVPFAIDWANTPHPASRGLPAVELRTWRLTHPAPERLRAALRAMDAGLAETVDITVGEPALITELAGPAGSVLLT